MLRVLTFLILLSNSFLVFSATLSGCAWLYDRPSCSGYMYLVNGYASTQTIVICELHNPSSSNPYGLGYCPLNANNAQACFENPDLVCKAKDSSGSMYDLPKDEPSDPCRDMGKDGVDGWRVVGNQCVFSHDFCETTGNIELYQTCNQTVCRADQITLPSGFCLDNPNQSCNPNSPDYVGTFSSGIHLCNGESAPEGFDPLNDPACSVQTGTVNGDRYTYVKCMSPEENAAMGDDAIPDSCGKDKVFLNGMCQSTPLVSDVYDDEAIVLHDDGTSTKTTTSTTRSTDKTTGETTTTKTTTITNYDAQGNEVSSETSIEGKTEKSTAHGGASCEVAPACTGDAVQCAILHQTWLNRCSSQSEKVTLDSIDFGTGDIQGGGDFQTVELIGEDNRDTHDVSAIFSDLPAVGSTSATCPVMTLELGAPYGTLDFDFKPICDFGDYTRPIFSAIGYFILGMFLFATLRRL